MFTRLGRLLWLFLVVSFGLCSNGLGACLDRTEWLLLNRVHIVWARVVVDPSDCIYAMSTLPRRLCWSTPLNTFELFPNCVGRLYGQALSLFPHSATLFWLSDMIGHGQLCISHAHTFCAQDVVTSRILI